MEARPSNFIVSIVYLLGVVLPGSIVTFLAVTGPLRAHLPNSLVAVPPDSVQAWIIFAIAAYVVGQVLYGFGSWFLDNIYDRTYRRYKQFLKGEPKEFVRPLVESHFRDRPQPTFYSWARAYVVTHSPAALSELEYLEADFKFFRSLALVFLVAPLEAIAVSVPEWEWAVVVGAILAVIGSLMKAYIDVMDRRKRVAKAPKEALAKPLDPSRLNRSLDAAATVTATGIAIVLGFGAILVLNTAGAAAAALFLVGFGVVFLRFCQQRWQRNESTYEYAAAVAAGQDDRAEG